MTPLVLVVGFLGSGKTTFLKALVPALAARGIRPGLLINDYQNAKIDAEQFRDLIDEVRAVSGDCVCCGSRDQLFEELQKFRHDPGRVMLVETNGTTDAAVLIEALALDPNLRHFTAPLQISLIDASRWQKRFWHNALEREQARTATHVVISRRDEVPEVRMGEVLAGMEKAGIRGRVSDALEIADELATLAQAVAHEPARELGTGCSCGHDHSHDHSHHEEHGHDHAEDHHFASLELSLPASVPREVFAKFLKDLPREVIRAKGLVRFAETPKEFFVFQKVERDVQYFPVGPSPRIQVPLALFIGPSLEATAIRKSIEQLF